ncbi:MAG: HD domain-containing phosphohydrolase [Gemmatimonadaceae bacterium]
MKAAVTFLTSLGQSLSTMMLYSRDHPAWERAMEMSFNSLNKLQFENRDPRFSFIGRDVIYEDSPLHELRDWPWSARLAEVGIQRLEFGHGVRKEEYAEFLADVLSRIVRAGVDTYAIRTMPVGASLDEAEVPGATSLVKRRNIRFGALVVHNEEGVPADEAIRSLRSKTPERGLAFGLAEEINAVNWIQTEVETKDQVPLIEADAVVHSLSVAMRGSSSMIVPLLRLKASDPYNAIHSINVSVLVMALAEFLGMRKRDVHAFGTAGLLHDIGMARMPKEVLAKPDRLTDDERAIIERHPLDGARIIAASDQRLEIAASVAYEHHLRPDGSGYPHRAVRRPPQYPSRLVRICSVYNALRIARAHRQPYSAAAALTFIEERSGTEFDAEIAKGFAMMMRRLDARVSDFDRDVAIKTPPIASEAISEHEIHH